MKFWAQLHLYSVCVLHWWRVNASHAREPSPCTHPLTPSTRLGKPQVPFFKFRESNPHQL